MNKEQAIKEINVLWSLNDNTTIKDIEEYYYDITGLHNLSTGAKLNYLYEYIIEDMFKSDEITEDVADELYKHFKIGVEGDE